VIALDGRSGVGKSELARTLARTLAEALAEAEPVQVVRLDDVYPGWDGLLPVVPWLRRWLLQPLQAGHPAGYHRYDWTRGTYGEWQPVAAGGVLLLEGVGSGAALLAPYRSLLLWLQAPDDARRERAIARDGPAFAREWDRWAAQEQHYLTRDDPRRHAEVIVDTAGPTAVLGARHSALGARREKRATAQDLSR
jgi:uridine kinase